MATQTAMPNTTRTKPAATPQRPIRSSGAQPVMYSDGLPSLCEMDSEELNIIYPPKTEKMPDGIEHAINFIKIVPLLRHILDAMDIEAFALGDIYIYYLDEYGRRERVAPDALIALGVTREDAGEDESYFVERLGKPPDFVMEIASRSTHRVDLEAKPPVYAQIGVSEYWLLDPFGGRYYGFPLRGMRLIDGEYVEIEMEELEDGALRGHSEVLDLDLYWMDGDFRIRDPSTGRWLVLPTQDDLEARATAEARAIAAEETSAAAEARAIAAEETSAAAEARATAAEAENADLREQLRRMRERR